MAGSVTSKDLIFAQIVTFFYSLICEASIPCPSGLFLSSKACFCGVILNNCDFHCLYDEEPLNITELFAEKVCLRRAKSSIDNLLCEVKSSQIPGQSLLCIANSNSPFLGYVFDNSPIATNAKQYFKLLNLKTRQAHLPSLSYSGSINSDHTQYEFGKPLLILNNLETRAIELPLSIGFGLCMKSVAIKYLVEQDSLCFVWLSPTSCSGHLNASAFLSAILDDGMLLIKTNNGIQKLKPYVEFNHPNYTLALNSDNAYPATVLKDGYCSNFTKSVELKFYWNSDGVVDVKIFLNLDSMVINNSMELQHYKVNFLMIDSSGVGPAPKTLDIGYRYQDPVLAVFSSLHPSVNLTEIISLDSNASASNSALFQFETFNFVGSSIDSGCNDRNSLAVNFGIDLSYSCWISIAKELYANCDQFRLFAYDFLLERYPSFLHSGENLGQFMKSHGNIVPVIRAPLLDVQNLTSDFGCLSIPNKVTLTILYLQEHLQSFPISRILGSKLEFFYVPMDSKPLQRVYMHFGVQFINVNDPQKYLPRFRRRDNLNVCPGGICWEELLFPLTHHKTFLDVSIGYVMSSVVLFLVFIGSYYYLAT